MTAMAGAPAPAAAPSRLDVYCMAGWGTVGTNSHVYIYESKITAIQVKSVNGQ